MGIHCLNPLIKNKILINFFRLLNKIQKYRFGNIHIEISLLIKRKSFDLVYCVNGEMFIIPILKKMGIIKFKLVILLYRLPAKTPFWKFHNLHHSRYILSTYDGINCLTKYTQKQLQTLLPKKKHFEFLEWYTDTEFYSSTCTKTEGYFFSTGKTNRDYRTLIQAAKMNCNLTFVVIGHFDEELLNLAPSNMKIIRTEVDQTDTAISYSELKEYYSRSIAVCIPLNHDPEDTCGFTELLESMAMGKPVIKAKTGCLDINIEEENVGYYYEAHNPYDLSNKLKLVYNNPATAVKLGSNGRRLVDKKYNIDIYSCRVKRFLNRIN